MWFPGLILVVAAVLAYLPALHGGFVWDDDAWTTGIANLLRDSGGLRLMWARFTSLQQYYPLSGTTFWLDYQLWGFQTLPYHVENILLHALAAILFWRLLRRLDVPGAWLAAAIFALHPVMVESVAWITERKNVLSLVLYLGALHAYGRFTRFWSSTVEGSGCSADLRSAVSQTSSLPGGGKSSGPADASAPIAAQAGRRPAVQQTGGLRYAFAPPRRLAYALALLLLTAALLAKATAFSLPAVLLLVCWWKRGSIRWREDVLPTVPFFILAIGFSLVTRWLETGHVGAHGSVFAFSFGERCLIAGRALWFYAGKLLWPANLCFVYPRWQPDSGAPGQWLYPVSAAGALLALWLARSRVGRGPAAAAFFFAGTLFPVLGFMNAYGMRFSFVWDHWVYLSSLGPIALGAAAVARAASPSPLEKKVGEGRPQTSEGSTQRRRDAETQRKPGMKILDHGLHGFLWVSFIRAIRVIRGQFLWWVRPGCAGLCVFAVLVLPVLGLLTWRQSGMYTDIETLWNTTLERNPNAAMPHYNLGLVLLQKGQKDEAMAHFQTAVQLEPDYTEARNNLGGLLLIQGRVDEAIAQFRQVIEAEPDHARAHYNLAKAFLQRGESEQAIAHFQKALEGHPNSTPDSGSPSSPSEPDAPGAAFEREFFAEVHEDLAQVLVQKGRVDDAIVHFKLALERRPDDATAYSALGALFEQKHQAGNAIGHYRMALKLQPQNADVLNNLAWIRAANAEAGFRDGPEAVDLAERACRLTDFRQPLMVGTLAAAYAEAGRFDDAVATAEKARALAIALGQQDVAAKNLELIRLFKARQPYREAF